MEIPIKKEMYEKYRNELYKINEEARLMFDLDTSDINHSDNLKKIIDFQTKLVAMLNHALLNKIYWKKIINKTNNCQRRGDYAGRCSQKIDILYKKLWFKVQFCCKESGDKRQFVEQV